MVEFRDKGPIPLHNPDAKIYAVEDVRTGFICEVSLDLQAKRFALWWQPDGWRTPDGGVSYGNVDVTDGVLAVHDGHAKLLLSTWKETSPDGKAHFGILDFMELYNV